MMANFRYDKKGVGKTFSMIGGYFLKGRMGGDKNCLPLYPENYDVLNNAKKKLEFSIC